MAERISDQPFENNLTVGDCECEFGRAIEEVLGETTVQIYNVRSSRIGISIRVEKKKGETVFRDFLLTTLEVQSDSASEETVNPKKDSIELPPKEQELLESTTNANLESSAKTQRSQEQSLPQVPESKTGTQKEGFTSTLHSVQTSTESLSELDFSALQKKGTECLAEKSTETALTVPLSENSTLEISFEARTEVRHGVSEHQPEVYYSKIEDEKCSFEIRDKQSALVVQDQKRLTQSGSHSHSKDTDEILVRKIQSEDYGSDSQNQKYPSDTSTGMQLRDSTSEYSFPGALAEKHFSYTQAEKQSEDLDFCPDAPSQEVSDVRAYGRTFDVSADEHFRDIYADQPSSHAPAAEVSDIQIIQIQGELSDAAEKLHPDTKAEESSDIQIEILPHIPAEQVSDARTEGRPPVAAEEYFPDTQTEEALDIQSGKSLPDSPGDEVSGTQAEKVSGSHLENVPDTLDEVSDTQAEEASGSQLETLPDTTDDVPDTQAELASGIQLESVSDTLDKEVSDTQAAEASGSQLKTLPDTTDDVPDTQAELASGSQLESVSDTLDKEVSDTQAELASGSQLESVSDTLDKVSDTQAELASGSQLESVSDTLDKEVSDTQAEEASGTQLETLPDTIYDDPDTQAELASGSQLESVSDTLDKEVSDTQAEEASGSQLKTLPDTTDDVPDTQAELASGSQLESVPDTLDKVSDTQAEEASGSQLKTLPDTTDDVPDTQAELASGSQLESVSDTLDKEVSDTQAELASGSQLESVSDTLDKKVSDTQAEEASGTQLETLPDTIYDDPDTQAEEASGSQLETLPATTDDVPDTQAELASGSQLETLPATTDDVPDTQAEFASGSQLETLPATTDDVPDTQAELASGSQLESVSDTLDKEGSDTQAEEASGTQLETLPDTIYDDPDTQAELASGSQLETLPDTTDDDPDTQAEEASGSQLETLPATTDDVPDTQAELASGSQLETLPDTTDDDPDTQAEEASGSQLESVSDTLDKEVSDTQAEDASGSQLETLPDTTDDPDTQAEDDSDLKTEELVAQGQSEMVSNFPDEQHSSQVSAVESQSEGTGPACLQDTKNEMIQTDLSESSILTPEIPQTLAESSVHTEIVGIQTDSVETQNQRHLARTAGNESPPELTPYIANIQACFIQAYTQELTSEVQSEMPEVPTVEGTQEAHTESSPTKTETQDPSEVSIEGAGAKLVESPAEEHTPEVLATAALETCTEGHAEGQLKEDPSGTQDYESPVQYASKTDVAGDSDIETGKACQEDLNAGELHSDKSPHHVSSVEGKSPDESIPSSPKGSYSGAGCISQKAVSSDRAAVSTILTFQYGSQGSTSPGATSTEVLNIEHPEPRTDDHAYVMGDKIDELFPFVYAVSTPLIDFRCSYCFTLLTNKRKCNSCPHAFYCNRYCQDKDLRIHKRECVYLRKLRRPEVPIRMIRMLARAVLRKEDPLGKKTFYKFGDKSYYFQDLPPHTDVVSSSEFNFSVKNAYHHFRNFLHDRPISYEEFCILYGKVNRHMTYVIEAPGLDVGMAMYFGLVGIEHSCRPNANITFIGNKAQIIACQAIEAADPAVTLSLLPLKGKTEGRTSVLMFKGREPCKCHLCKSGEADAKFYEVIGEDSADDKIREAEKILCYVDERMGKLGPDQKTKAFEAISTLDGVTGNLHNVRTSLIEVATDFSERDKDYRNAIVYGRELLRIYRYLFGDVHPAIVNRLLNLSVSYNLARDALKAREYYSEALQVAYNTYGSEHPFFKRIRFCFIQQEESKWEKAHSELQYHTAATYLYRV